MKFNFVVIPYRDIYFYSNYGNAVRDLMLLNALTSFECVNKIYLINRPVSLYERFLLLKPKSKLNVKLSSKVEVIDSTSFDLIGPLGKRLWTINCYTNLLKKMLKRISEFKRKDAVNVLLDFTPLALIPYEEFKKNGFLIWYDIIDNFTKHNRYSLREKKAVEVKYMHVDRHADMITGVSNKALEQFSVCQKKLCVNNGVLDNNVKNEDCFNGNEQFLFGYIGFISDRLNVQFIKKISTFGKVVLFGEVYDRNVVRKFNNSKNIILKGKFKSSQLPEIMKTFKIGIIPYKLEKDYDSSPLKLYQYLYYGKPVVSSMGFEDRAMKCKYVLVSEDLKEIENFIDRVKKPDNCKEVKKCFDKSFLWSYKVKEILDELLKISLNR